MAADAGGAAESSQRSAEAPAPDGASATPAGAPAAEASGGGDRDDGGEDSSDSSFSTLEDGELNSKADPPESFGFDSGPGGQGSEALSLESPEEDGFGGLQLGQALAGGAAMLLFAAFLILWRRGRAA
jgi:hypothetical protein